MPKKEEKKIIVIIGDSWGCGEWNGGYVVHQGLAQYLSDSGHAVINLSQGGGDNLGSITKLRLWLTTMVDPSAIDMVISFQTSWTRDLELNQIDVGYDRLKEKYISKFYYELSDLASKNRFPVYIIGGLSDTLFLDNWKQEYPGTKILCQSCCNFLLENKTNADLPNYFCEVVDKQEILTAIKSKSNNLELQHMLDDIDSAWARVSAMQNSPLLFWPDGVHPNRHGHKKLFDLVVNQIENL